MNSLTDTRIGSQKPRIAKFRPPIDDYAAKAALKVANLAGLVPYDWQKFVAYNGLGQDDEGKWLHRKVACFVPRQNGKGAIIEIRVLLGLFVLKEQKIVYTSVRSTTATQIFRRIVKLCSNTPELDAQCTYRFANGQESIKTRDGCEVTFVTRTDHQSRGITGNCVFIDEAYGYTDSQAAAMEPVVSAVFNSQMWFFSTPPLDAATAKPMYRLRERALSDNVGSLAYFDWGAEQGVDLDDQNAWYATNPGLGPADPTRGGRIELETVADERLSLTDENFARERLGVWPEQAASHVVAPSVWASCANPESQPGEKLVFAIDVSPDRTASVGVASKTLSGKMHVDLIHSAYGTAWVLDWLRNVRESGKFDPLCIVMDNGGPGKNLLVELENAGFEVRNTDVRDGCLVVTNTGDVVAACLSFVDGVTAGRIEHRDNPKLNIAVNNSKTRPVGDGWAWARKKSDVDISPLVAVTLAVWAYDKFADLQDEYAEPTLLWL